MTATREVWTRHFPSFRMTSRLLLGPRRVHEVLGPARLAFELVATDGGRLLMRLQRLRFLGLTCPRGWMPRLLAEETGDGDRLAFKVQASLPWIGVVTSYRGHLVIPLAEFDP